MQIFLRFTLKTNNSATVSYVGTEKNILMSIILVTLIYGTAQVEKRYKWLNFGLTGHVQQSSTCISTAQAYKKNCSKIKQCTEKLSMSTKLLHSMCNI